MVKKRKRHLKKVIEFIKTENASYREIQKKLKEKFGIDVPKSTISYYKRRKTRTKHLNFDSITCEEWDWLRGLFSADGTKYISRDKYGKHYIVKISLSKKHDAPIATKCINVLKAIGIKPTLITEKNCLRIKVSSKQLFYALNKHPPESLTPAYIAGAIDGDGWIDHNVAIQFGQSAIPELFDKILEFFKKIEVTVAIWETKRGYRRMYISYSVLKQSGILNFSIKAQQIKHLSENGGAGEI